MSGKTRPMDFWDKIVQSKENEKALRTEGSWHADGWERVRR